MNVGCYSNKHEAEPKTKTKNTLIHSIWVISLTHALTFLSSDLSLSLSLTLSNPKPRFYNPHPKNLNTTSFSHPLCELRHSLSLF